ncbi:hypothetical protein BDQ17DRAFT_1333255 [Cyathus striatus]|nr:hypothetical protein BDQ17DRAFT_1333255 [Cyathus striatus]
MYARRYSIASVFLALASAGGQLGRGSEDCVWDLVDWGEEGQAQALELEESVRMMNPPESPQARRSRYPNVVVPDTIGTAHLGVTSTILLYTTASYLPLLQIIHRHSHTVTEGREQRYK